MKVSQIAKICKELANLDLPPNCYQTEGDDYSASDCAKLLLVASNVVLDDLYCNWTPSLCKAVVCSHDGFIDTQSLLLNSVVRLTDSQGDDVTYRYTERGLFVQMDGTFNLLYAKLPPTVDWNYQFVLPSPKITPRIFAYGVLAEYFHSIADDVQMQRYQAKYQDALHVATRKLSPMKMPARRWWK